MFSEITVIIKDEEKSLRKTFPIYDIYEVSESNPIIMNCVAVTLKNFDAQPLSVKVRIAMDIG